MVDVVPFAARRAWVTPRDYEIWWEDPRDLSQVVVQFAPGTAPSPDMVSLEYWQHSWPGVRVPKGALVGSGGTGWLAIDGWTNGRWQKADCQVKPEGDRWSFTLHPLNRQEFPGEKDFPAEFRRTIKVRLNIEVPQDQPVMRIEALHAYTDSEWREAEIAIEWKSLTGELARWDGHLEAFNGEVLAVKPLAGDVSVLDSGQWQSTVEGTATAGVRATVRYAYNEDVNSYDRTIVTVRSDAHSFSFLVDDVLAGEPIYVRDLGVVVSRADAGVRLAEFEATWERGHDKTIYQRVRETPEQTWERAWADMPAKKRAYVLVLGCEGSRQKFGIDPTGDIFLGENYIRRVPGKDTPRLG